MRQEQMDMQNNQIEPLEMERYPLKFSKYLIDGMNSRKESTDPWEDQTEEFTSNSTQGDKGFKYTKE